MTTSFSHPELPVAVVLDALGASGFEVGHPHPSTRTVLDTFDGRLHDAGLRLERYRSPAAELVLRGGGGAEARLAWPGGDPRWPTELPPGPLRARLLDVTQERALLPLLTVSSERTVARRLDQRGKATVVVEVHAQPTVPGSASSLPAWVAQIMPVHGHADAADAVITRLAKLGLHRGSTDVMEWVARQVGVALEGRRSSPTVALRATDEALGAFRSVLANLLATIELNLDGTIADTDPEFLHELRVAVRRTRSVLSESKGVLPAAVRAEQREAFGWLGQLTSAARDLDVYVIGWEDYVAPLTTVDAASLDRVRVEIETRRATAHAELSEALQGDRARALLTGWKRWLTDPDVGPPRPQPIGPYIAGRIAKAQAKVLRDGRAITPRSPAERLHDLRKDTKKLRYLLECFGSLLEPKGRKAFVGQLKELQDNLGAHQDAEIHLSQLRELAHDLHERASVDTDALLAMGRLSDHLDRRRRRERDDFAQRFAAYDTPKNRKALERLLRPLERA